MLSKCRKDFPMQPSLATPARAATNRSNALHSTGPRTESGKSRSALNALTHGLSSRTAVLPTEDAAAYEHHCGQFDDEYQPKTPTEIQLVRELADTAWRLNRIPLLEADLLARATNHRRGRDPIAYNIVDLHRTLATLGLHGQRLSRQFHKTLDQLRAVQSDRRACDERDLKRAAALLELHKHKGIQYDPAQDGFVFSLSEIEAHSRRLMRLNESRHVEYIRFHAPAQLAHTAGR
jgi:hypothetical protein